MRIARMDIDLTNEELSEFIKFHRKSAGLTQTQLGKLMGKHVASISAYEQGATFPSDHEEFLRQLREVVKKVIDEKRNKPDLIYSHRKNVRRLEG